MGDLIKPVDRIVALVERLVGPLLDETGNVLADLVGISGADRLHAIRERKKKNLDKVLQTTERMIEEAEIQIQPVPLKVLEPIFSNSSLEDDTFLQEKWAALLANAATRNNENPIHPSFPEILRQLSPEEAKLLDNMYSNDGMGAFTGMFARSSSQRWFTGIVQSGASSSENNLERLGLIENELYVRKHDSPWPGAFGGSDHSVEKGSYRLTPLGRVFVETCRPPQKKS